MAVLTASVFDFDHFDLDQNDRLLNQFLKNSRGNKKVGKTFVNRNESLLPLHRE